MNDSVKQLLDAEAAVQRTIEGLDRLQAAVGKYDSARGALENTGQQLSGLVSECKAIAAATVEGVRVLRDLSMPKVLDELGSMRGIIEGSAAKTEGRLQSLDEYFRASGRQNAVDLEQKALAALNDMGGRMNAQVAALHDEVKSVTEAAGTALDGRLAAGLSNLREFVQGVADQVQQRLQTALAEHSATQAAAFDGFAVRLQTAIDGIGERTKTAVADSVAEFRTALALEARARDEVVKETTALAERVRSLESVVAVGTSEVGRLRSMVVVLLVLAVVMPLATLAVILFR